MLSLFAAALTRYRIFDVLPVGRDRAVQRMADGYILANLFRNAVEHGGDDVTVRVGALAPGTGFYVADGGAGLPETARDETFEFGYSTAEDGTGFGLAIVTEIAEAHGWEIHVTDSEEGGARFEITGDGFAE